VVGSSLTLPVGARALADVPQGEVLGHLLPAPPEVRAQQVGEGVA